MGPKMKIKKIIIQTCLIILMVFSMNVFSQNYLDLQPSNYDYAPPDSRGGIYVDETWVWVADHEQGLWRAKKCDGSSAGIVSSTYDLWDIYHSGNYIYGAGIYSSYGKIVIYNDMTGQYLGSASTSSIVYGVYAAGDYAYLAGNAGIEVFNVSNPSSPYKVRTLDTSKDFSAVRGAGNYIYASQYTDDQLYIYDIGTSPSYPTRKGIWDPYMSYSSDIRRLFVDGTNNLVYVANDDGDLYIVDVSNPLSPFTKGSLFSSGGSNASPGGGVFVANNFAFLTTGNMQYAGYLRWIDVSDPAHPSLIDYYYNSSNGFYDCYVDECRVHVVGHNGYFSYNMIGFKPDGYISNTDESNYIGGNIYNSTGVNQTKSQQINYGDSATFKIKLENDTSDKLSLTINGQSGTNGWSYIYLDDNNIDITADIQNGTFFTDQLATGGSTTITLKMVPDETVVSNTVKTDIITVSAGVCDTGTCTPNTSVIDVVVASTTLLEVLSSIGDYVWNDADEDGNQDVSENGIANVILHLLTSAGDTVATTTTNSNGIYSFTDLTAGNYWVHVKDGSLPPLYRTTTNNDPLLVNLGQGENFTGADFGYKEKLDTDDDSIPDEDEGTDDRDGDGKPNNEDYDPAGYIYNEATGEIISGGSIQVAGPGAISYIHNGASGFYEFYTDGTPGTYTITLTVPPGYIVSTTCLPLDPPPYDPTGQSNPVILGNGENGASGYLTSNDCTPFYYTFALEDGDPFIKNNNFPLKQLLYDFGDAPDPTYPTLSISNGASHLIASGYFLGASVDDENDGQPDASSLGDDNDGNDDDDGVTFTSPFIQLFENSLDIVASGNGYINAWMDFNRDGDWDDAGENIISENAVTSGTNTINFQIPQIDLTGAERTIGVSSRFRYSTQQALSYNGVAPDGEVEDYLIDVLIPVDIAVFEVISKECIVHISWSTFTETENLGFHIFRSDTKDGQYEQITQAFIPGAGNSENKKKYNYIDDSVKAGITYYYHLADYSLTGQKRMHKPVKVFVGLPSNYLLKQNYPNPFNPNTRIKFSIKEAGKVQLKIYNMQGQSVNTLMNRYAGPGSYNASWNGTNSLGHKVPSGVYYYTLQVNGFQQSRKMILAK
jgi:hypothetical protein